MATTTAPLMGFGASGQLGKSMVHAHWKGRTYARKYVVPKNPQSTGQMLTRDIFSFLSNMWKTLPAQATAPTQLYVKGKALTDRNRFTSMNLAAMRTDTTLDNFRITTGAGGAPPPVAAVPTGGAGTVSIALAPASEPSGWSLVAYHAAAFKQSYDPHDKTATPVFVNSDPTGPVVISIGVAGTYIARVWSEHTKPDGTTAFSPDIVTASFVVT